MIKYFCDVCGKEKNMERLNNFSYPYHIEHANNAYEIQHDEEGNKISNTQIYYNLCNECYNKVMLSAYQEIKNLSGYKNGFII